MKSNHKSRPQIRNYKFQGQIMWRTYAEDLTEWADTQENELRRDLEIYDEGPLEKTKYDVGRADQIKEILGEE